MARQEICTKRPIMPKASGAPQAGFKANNSPSLVSWAGLAISIGALLYSAGSVGEQVKANTRDISALQVTFQTMREKNGDDRERLARIETKLDLVLSAKGDARATAKATKGRSLD